MGHKDAEWLYDTPPAGMQPGWYATVFSFELGEGLTYGAHYWTGKEWREGPDEHHPWSNTTVGYWPKVFATKKEAEYFCSQHGPRSP
jgi:hypothetical protein